MYQSPLLRSNILINIQFKKIFKNQNHARTINGKGQTINFYPYAQLAQDPSPPGKIKFSRLLIEFFQKLKVPPLLRNFVPRSAMALNWSWSEKRPWPFYTGNLQPRWLARVDYHDGLCHIPQIFATLHFFWKHKKTNRMHIFMFYILCLCFIEVFVKLLPKVSQNFVEQI